MNARLKEVTYESTGEVQKVGLREISEKSIKKIDVDRTFESIEAALRAQIPNIVKLEPSAHSQVLEVKSYLNSEKPEVEHHTLDEFPEEPFGQEVGLESVSSWKNLADLKIDQFRTANVQKWLVLAKNLSEIGGQSSYRVGDSRFGLIMKYNISSFKKFDGVAECLFNNILNGTADERDVDFDEVTILECLDKWILAYVNHLADLGQDMNQIDEDLAKIIRNLIIARIYNDKNEVLNRFNSDKFNGPLRAFLKITLAEATKHTLPGDAVVLTRTEKIERSFPSLTALLSDLSKSTEQLLAIKNYDNLLIIEGFERKLIECKERLIRLESQYDSDEDAQNQLVNIKQKIFSLSELLRVARKKTEEYLALEKAKSYLHFDASIGETLETPRPYKFPALKGNIGRMIVLFPGWVSVGNAPANILELPNATDFHGELSFDGKQWLVTEKNIKRGSEPVRIDGECLMPTYEGLASDIVTRKSKSPVSPLKNGCKVRFGKHILTYEENHEFTQAAIKIHVDRSVSEYLELAILCKDTVSEDNLKKAKEGMDYLLLNGLITRNEYLAKQPDYLIRAALQNPGNIGKALVKNEHENKEIMEKERNTIRASELADFIKKCTARKIKLSAEETDNLPALCKLFGGVENNLDREIILNTIAAEKVSAQKNEEALPDLMKGVESSDAYDIAPLITLSLWSKNEDYEKQMIKGVYVKMEQILNSFFEGSSLKNRRVEIAAMIELGFKPYILKFIDAYVSKAFQDGSGAPESGRKDLPPQQLKKLREILMTHSDQDYRDRLYRRIKLEMQM